MRRLARAIAPLAIGAVACAGGCYSNQKGVAPPDNSLYFPTGLALSNSRGPCDAGVPKNCGAKWLFVLNSNFDLRYDAGWLAALDLEKVVDAIALPRVAPSDKHGYTCFAEPTQDDCGTSDATQFSRASVRFGSFGADVQAIPLHKTDDAGSSLEPVGKVGRMLIPVRGDATLTIVDWEESSDNGITLHCAPRAQENTFSVDCSSAWRIGSDPNGNTRQLTLEGEPFSIAVPSYWPKNKDKEPQRSGGIAAIVHQSLGDVSVFIGTSAVAGRIGDAPDKVHLVYTLSGGSLPPGGTSIAALDLVSPKETDAFTPRFLVTSQTQPGVYQISYFGDQGTPDRSALFVDGLIPIQTNSAGYDSRGIVVDPPNDGETRPMRVFVTNRTPPSLVMGNLDPVLGGVRFFANFPLPIGPSRIVRSVVPVLQSDGTVAQKTRIFAASFDGRWLTTIDPDRTTDPVVDVARTGRGPYAMVIDPVRKLGFVTNFTESTVQVLDLDPIDRTDKTSPNPQQNQIVFTIGVPTLPAF